MTFFCSFSILGGSRTTFINLINIHIRSSLAVQWLRLQASTAGGGGSIPGWELRSHMPRGTAKNKTKQNKTKNPKKHSNKCSYQQMYTWKTNWYLKLNIFIMELLGFYNLFLFYPIPTSVNGTTVHLAGQVRSPRVILIFSFTSHTQSNNNHYSSKTDIKSTPLFPLLLSLVLSRLSWSFAWTSTKTSKLLSQLLLLSP